MVRVADSQTRIRAKRVASKRRGTLKNRYLKTGVVVQSLLKNSTVNYSGMMKNSFVFLGPSVDCLLFITTLLRLTPGMLVAMQVSTVLPDAQYPTNMLCVINSILDIFLDDRCVTRKLLVPSSQIERMGTALLRNIIVTKL